MQTGANETIAALGRRQIHGPVIVVAAAATGIQRNRYDFEVRVHEVGAMAWAVDPTLHHIFNRAVANRDVFTDAAPGITGGSHSIADGRVAGTGMGQGVVRLHVLRLACCRRFQLAVPTKRTGCGKGYRTAISCDRTYRIDLGQGFGGLVGSRTGVGSRFACGRNTAGVSARTGARASTGRGARCAVGGTAVATAATCQCGSNRQAQGAERCHTYSMCRCRTHALARLAYSVRNVSVRPAGRYYQRAGRSKASSGNQMVLCSLATPHPRIDYRDCA